MAIQSLSNIPKLKILISAYACRPNMGSEPGVGWNIIQQLLDYFEIWVITREDNRTYIEAELQKNPVSQLHFIYCDLPAWANWWNYKKKGVQLHYYLWQIIAYFAASKYHREVNFNLVHHVTYVKYWSPSFLCLLPIPFVWGPVGGGESAPKTFWQDFSWRGKLYEGIRNAARWIGEKDPFVLLTIRKSTIVRATTEDTAKRLYKIGANYVQVLTESGLSQEDVKELAQYQMPSENCPFRFISMGRLLHWKGFHLGLRAFAQANIPNTEYWIVGEGPELERLKKLALELKIVQKVKFWGLLPRTEALNKLSKSHVLVHPSLHDSGGWVCIEAMAAGRPVICLELGGPNVQVTKDTGFKIPAFNPSQTVNGIASAMVSLANSPQLTSDMSRAGKKLVAESYTWQAKGKEIKTLYKDILES
jgi:glycosyltransferase involved in cell wall biosynthesis